MINALFVEANGPYSNIPGVIPWDKERNALNCRNGLPAIAHPPCERWGRYWSGGPSVREKKKLGDDAGCFAFALWYVRTYGGVLEHPEGSHAFRFYGLPVPSWKSGWTEKDIFGGRSCCVSQGNYGHRARKLTWLYAHSVEFPELDWSIPTDKMAMEPSARTKESGRALRRSEGYVPVKRISAFERLATPIEFRDLLIRITQSASVSEKEAS